MGHQAQPNSPYAMTVADTRNVNVPALDAPTLVQCEPHQEAVLQRSIVAGREVAQVTCVTARRRGLRGARLPCAPAGYEQPVAVQPDIVQRPVVRTQTVRPRAQRVVAAKKCSRSARGRRRRSSSAAAPAPVPASAPSPAARRAR